MLHNVVAVIFPAGSSLTSLNFIGFPEESDRCLHRDESAHPVGTWSLLRRRVEVFLLRVGD